jgi:hypothetical protein
LRSAPVATAIGFTLGAFFGFVAGIPRFLVDSAASLLSAA